MPYIPSSVYPLPVPKRATGSEVYYADIGPSSKGVPPQKLTRDPAVSYSTDGFPSPWVSIKFTLNGRPAMLRLVWNTLGCRAAAVALASLACGGCLVTTTAPPIEPGMEKLPAANVAAREQIVIDQLTMIKRGEDLHFATKGSYATMQQLVDDGSLNYAPTGLGYTIDITVTGSGYQLVAVPTEYGPKGRRSFYLDQSGTVRGDDHQGGAATAADPPV